LENFSLDELRDLVLTLSRALPHLAEAIDQAMSAPQSTSQAISTMKTSVQPPHPQVNTEVARLQAHSAIHRLDRMRSSEAYGYVGEVVGEVEQIARKALDLLAGSDGRDALALLESVTDEYTDEWINLDDSDGYAGELFRDLGKLWAEVLLSTELSRKEREAWAEKLTYWQEEIEEYGIDDAFDIAVTAALLGWDSRPLQEVLQGHITAQGAWEGEPPYCADDLTQIRLTILERQGRLQAYLYLAKAEGQTEAYLTMLVRLDRAQEAFEYGRKYLATPAEALTLARVLCEHGEHEQSVQIAQQGLALEGRRAELAVWLRDQAEAMGKQDLALSAAEQAFRAQINLENYRYAAKLAGEQWSARKTALLDYARTAQTYETQGKVDVFLHEGLIDDAIAVVEGYASHTIVEQVVDAALKERPEWVIQACKKQAESIMNGGKAQYYDAAARWLSKARQAYQIMSCNEEWQSYLVELLQLHGRKYKLVPLLKAIR
jgi:uncharacterized Zn finger protein